MRGETAETSEEAEKKNLSKLRTEGHAALWPITKCLLELHAVADRACRGVGIQSSPTESGANDGISDPSDRQGRFFLLANLLLTSTGSLSRIFRHHGIVVPKMRTPQLGMTLRSLSHHLTFHRTEVDIHWRAVPWTNVDEDTLNVMVVPYPWSMTARDFSPADHPQFAEELGAARYFRYKPYKAPLSSNGTASAGHEANTGADTAAGMAADAAADSGNPDEPEKGSDTPKKIPFDELPIEQAVDALLKKAQSEHHRIHVVILPEMAIDETQYQKIQEGLLKSKQTDEHVPILIAGIRDSQQEGGQEKPLGQNRMRLSACYADKWYAMDQHKHHRWCLDENQTQQYRLGSALPAGNVWWEAIELHPRKLSFLAPNSWLTLCPLICEDLARLEPVSELIRGVGPTLLIALLQDGPQLRERWPGRYASIFADDPGSSVLTLTSLAMSTRSVANSDVSQIQQNSQGEDKSRTVALWKDQVRGWREIRLDEDDRAAVLTLTAKHLKEYTADSRFDDQYASALVLRRVERIPQPTNVANRKSYSPTVTTSERKLFWGDQVDIVELTLFTFLAGATFEAAEERETYFSWFSFLGRSKSSKTSSMYAEYEPEKREQYILDRAFSAQNYPNANPDPDKQTIFRTPQYRFALYSLTLLNQEISRRVRNRKGNTAGDEKVSSSTSHRPTDDSAISVLDRATSALEIVRSALIEFKKIGSSNWSEIENEILGSRILNSGGNGENSGNENPNAAQSAARKSFTFRLRQLDDLAEIKKAVEPIERVRILLSTIESVCWTAHNRFALQRQRNTLQYQGVELLQEFELVLHEVQSISIFSHRRQFLEFQSPPES